MNIPTEIDILKCERDSYFAELHKLTEQIWHLNRRSPEKDYQWKLVLFIGSIAFIAGRYWR